MKNTISTISFALLIVNLISCKKSDEISLLKDKYTEIENKSMAALTIDSISIIEIETMSFEELAHNEFNRMNKLNDSLNKLVKIQFELDSLYAIKIEGAKKDNNFAFKGEDYYETFRKDSTLRKNEMISRFNNEIEILENKQQMLKIDQLVKNESTLTEESKMVKHKVEYTLDNQSYSDTLLLVVYGKSQYNYLTNNIFRKYE